MTYHARVTETGTVEIPAELRRELGINDGDSLTFDRDENGHLVIKTYEQIVREVRETFRRLRAPDDGTSVVDELSADRREEARRENAKLEQWLAERGIEDRG